MAIRKHRKFKKHKTRRYTRKHRKPKRRNTKHRYKRGGNPANFNKVIAAEKKHYQIKHAATYDMSGGNPHGYLKGGGCGCDLQSGGSKKVSGFNDKWGGRVAAFPPGPIYKPGVNNGACFYGYQTGVMAPPKNTDGLFYDTPRFIRGGKRQTKKNRRKKRGGNITHFLANNVPGFSALRDAVWKGEELLEDVYNRYRSLPPATNSSVYNQPIANQKRRRTQKNISVGSALLDGANKATQYSPLSKK